VAETIVSRQPRVPQLQSGAPAGLDDHVAEFAGQPVGAAQQRTVQDDARASPVPTAT
jgi:hypothetical protein